MFSSTTQLVVRVILSLATLTMVSRGTSEGYKIYQDYQFEKIRQEEQNDRFVRVVLTERTDQVKVDLETARENGVSDASLGPLIEELITLEQAQSDLSKKKDKVEKVVEKIKEVKTQEVKKVIEKTIEKQPDKEFVEKVINAAEINYQTLILTDSIVSKDIKDSSITTTDIATNTITDANISTISSSKISDLSTILASYLPMSGGTLAGKLTLSGTSSDLAVGGVATLSGATTIAGALTSSGAATFSGATTFKSSAVFDSNLTTGGDLTVSGKLSASGANLTSLNASSLSSGTIPSARLSLADSDIPDAITASNYLPLAGGTLAGKLTISGALSTGLDLSNAGITTALALGSNNVTVGGTTLSSTELALLDARTGTLLDTSTSWSGDLAGTGTSPTVAANAVALTTDTTGSYISSITTNSPISGESIGKEGEKITLSINADGVDFTEFADVANLDTATTIVADGSESLTIQNIGSGYSLVVEDESSDASPFLIDASGNVGIQTSNPGPFALAVAGPAQLRGSRSATGLMIDQFGRIGAGTATPDSSLTLQMGSGSGDAQAIGVANIETNSVSNTDTSETTLLSYTLPAYSLNTNGKAVRMTAVGRTSNNTNLKNLKFYFGTTPVVQRSGSLQNKEWSLKATVVRTGPLTQYAFGEDTIDALVPKTSLTSPGENLSSDVIIKITGQGESSGDITTEGLLVEYLGGD